MCKDIRKSSTIPIIFLTSRDSEIDRVVGLEIGMYSLVTWIEGDLQKRYLSILEKSMIDISQVLATVIAKQVQLKMADDNAVIDLRFEPLYYNFVDIYKKLKKNHGHIDVYITDKDGIVVYDSKNPQNVGKDFSQWNDVYLTLRGRYGARTSKPASPYRNTIYMYVSAPIQVYDSIIGVLTVNRPTETVRSFLAAAKKNIATACIIATILIVAFSIVFILWITKPIHRLTRYAQGVRDGQRMHLPQLGRSEIGDLGTAFEQMKETIEGKKYIENYVQTLTHEMKAPFSAISGAAELLQENMPEEKRTQFLANIQSETRRIQDMIKRLLVLSSVENRKELKNIEEIDIAQLTADECRSLQTLFSKKNITVPRICQPDIFIKGERFHLYT